MLLLLACDGYEAAYHQVIGLLLVHVSEDAVTRGGQAPKGARRGHLAHNGGPRGITKPPTFHLKCAFTHQVMVCHRSNPTRSTTWMTCDQLCYFFWTSLMDGWYILLKKEKKIIKKEKKILYSYFYVYQYYLRNDQFEKKINEMNFLLSGSDAILFDTNR